MQGIAIALVALLRAGEESTNMPNAPMPQAKQMLDCQIRAIAVVGANPGDVVVCFLVIDQDHRQPLLVYFGKLLGSVTRQDSQQSRDELCCQDALNNLTVVSL